MFFCNYFYCLIEIAIVIASIKEELRMVDVNVRPKRSKRLDYKAMIANEDQT